MVPQQTPRGAERFELRLEATGSQARTALTDTMQRLAQLGLPSHRAGDIQLVLAEALNNVVEHAYENAGHGAITLLCDLGPETLDICIVDTGKPLPGGVLPPAEFPDLAGPLDGLPEGGFGWCLIHELTSCVQYRRENATNYLSFGFRIS